MGGSSLSSDDGFALPRHFFAMKTRVHPAVCCANSPRHVLVAPDKFKGTLTSEQAARAIEHGLRRAWPDAKFTRFSLTDGGDDFARVLARAAGGRLYRVR